MRKNLVALFVILLIPTGVFAGGEITGVVGGLIGGDLNSLIDSGSFSLSRTFSNAPLYGARLGYNIPFVTLEGSIVGSPNGLSLDLEDLPATVDAKVYYFEANALFVPFPGPISPFVTAGIGIHYYDFQLQVSDFGALDASFNKIGYNYGAGLKVNIGRIVIRADVRDHVTEIGPADFDLEEIAEVLGFNVNEKLHNVEISFGVGISF